MAALGVIVVAMGAARTAEPAEAPIAYGPPAWSPDGLELAFAETSTNPEPDTVNRLLVVDVRTGRIREVTSGSEHRAPETAKWSPDGRFIAYGASQFWIWVIGRDGSGRKRVAGGGGYDWSPDSRRIAYDGGGIGGAIGVVELQSGKKRSITRRRYHAGPEWSPDGTRIAFTWRAPDKDSPPSVAVMRADGTRLAKLAPGSGPVWSRSGKTLAFSTFDGRRPDVNLMNADGTARRKLGTRGLSFAGVRPWSPDGQALLVTRTGGTVELLRLNSKRPKRLAVGSSAAWSPNGRQIAFVALHGCGHGVFIIDADGTNQRRLTACP